MSAVAEYPRWNLDVVFPGPNSPEFLAHCDRIKAGLAQIADLFARHELEKLDSKQTADASVAAVEQVLPAFNDLLELLILGSSYLSCLTTADTRDSAGLARRSEYDLLLAEARKRHKALMAWLGQLDVDAVTANSPVAQSHRYLLVRARITAQHLMPPALEDLASDLELTGSVAWEKLYDAFSSQILVPVGEDKLPMSAVRQLAYDADREVRARAYRAELDAWKQHEVPIAAAMNAIKGQEITLAKRRGWDSPLAAALHSEGLDQATLDAMLGAAREFFPDFRRFFHAKARGIGVESLAFYDLFAPVPGSTREWPVTAGQEFLTEAFDAYSPKMGDFARLAFEREWIDWGARPGKVGGAYCSDMEPGASRILMNYSPDFGSVETLAHEMGHAYHNLCLKDQPPLRRELTSSLAETASIFCEQVLRRHALQIADEAEQRVILNGALTNAGQVVVDITSRFLFESRLLAERAKRELSAEEMSEIMRQAQIETYGDGLDPNALHPYMWAAKPHYYGSSFYNFPYMFGLLFSMGLFAVYEEEGEAFWPRYDQLLSATGLAPAYDLAAEFGIDIRQPEFWRGSLRRIRAHIDRFETLV